MFQANYNNKQVVSADNEKGLFSYLLPASEMVFQQVNTFVSI